MKNMLRHHGLIALVLATAAAGGLSGCKKKTVPPVVAPSKAAPAAATAALPAPATATDGAAEATPVAAEPDPTRNAWKLTAQQATVKGGDRVFVLTQGANRAYDDDTKPYRLFAHDVGETKGELVIIKELSGGSFKTSSLFVIPAGSQPGEVKVGDMVLAEWASELKHAVVQKVDAEKGITVRYTDLPDTWPEDQLVKLVSVREVTRQKEGLSPGNFAFAKGTMGRDELVLLVGETADTWLVRQFSQRVRSVAKADLRPIPLKPSLKPGQLVEVPWIGQVYTGKVVKVSGTRVEVRAEGVQTKEPVVASLGQVAPVEAKKDAPKADAPK